MLMDIARPVDDRRRPWGTTSTFFLTWFPSYLVTYRHLDFIKAGFYASLPFVGAFAGVLCSGALSDWLYRREFSLSLARKAPIIGGLALSTSSSVRISWTTPR